VKRSLTRQIQIHVHPRLFKEEHLRFLESNLRKNPGKSRLRFVFHDKRERTSVSLSTLDKGFEMNDEMAEFLSVNPEFEVQVESA
jgi:DNA polymerase-3 subunit alpha